MFRDKERTQSKGWGRLLLFIIPTVILFAFISLFFVNSWYNQNLEPVDASGTSAEQVVIISPGSSVREISDQLKEEGIIQNSTVFAFYVGRQDDAELQAGTYRLSPGMSVESIVDELAVGKVATNLVTILPAKRLDQLQEDFIALGYDAQEVELAFSQRYDHPIFRDLPAGASIEGYVYPETYQIEADSSVEDILISSFDQLNELLTPEIVAALDAQGLNIHEALTLASIIERESGNVADQSAIAQVFLKRLDEGIILGSDVTFFYAAALSGEAPTPELESPYNTRIYGGLPPGPISNFNLSALEAIAAPDDTDYLFFVAGDDGITYFSETLAQHERFTELHCFKLCELPDFVE